jgi:hypothetical protein
MKNFILLFVFSYFSILQIFAEQNIVEEFQKIDHEKLSGLLIGMSSVDIRCGDVMSYTIFTEYELFIVEENVLLRIDGVTYIDKGESGISNGDRFVFFWTHGSGSRYNLIYTFNDGTLNSTSDGLRPWGFYNTNDKYLNMILTVYAVEYLFDEYSKPWRIEYDPYANK